MNSGMNLLVVSPSGSLVDAVAQSILLPAHDGSVGILKGHAPMIIALAAGKVVYDTSEGKKELDINGGVAKISGNAVTVLTD